MTFETIRRLYRINEDNGYSDKLIDEACSKWGGLPQRLKAYYKQLGRYNQLNHAQNNLCEPDGLIDAGDYIIFYKENQYAAQWAIKKTDKNAEDPPVYCSLDETNFLVEAEKMTDFLDAMSLFQALFGLQYSCEDIYMISEKQAEKIKENYKKKPHGLHQWMKLEFYGNNDDEVIYLCENDDYDMIYASSSKGHFYKLKEFINLLEPESY